MQSESAVQGTVACRTCLTETCQEEGQICRECEGLEEVYRVGKPTIEAGCVVGGVGCEM